MIFRRHNRSKKVTPASSLNQPLLGAALETAVPVDGVPPAISTGDRSTTPVTGASPVISASADAAPFTCHTCKGPIPCTIKGGHIRSVRSLIGERRFHKECFLCLHCGSLIDPHNEKFSCAEANKKDGSASADSKNSRQNIEWEDDEHPFHRECFSRHFSWMCVVCEQPLPMVTTVVSGAKSTKLEFLKHPFFEEERMCTNHAGPTGNPQRRGKKDGNIMTTTEEAIGKVRRCGGCHRFEPLSPDKRFMDVNDMDRCACPACIRTAVTSPQEVAPLWEKVLNFFEGPLGLLIAPEDGDGRQGVSRQDLENIPVVLVETNRLKRELNGALPVGSSEGVTRALCLSETLDEDKADARVKEILCLKGLPADLTSSILANMATHAWIALHPSFIHANPLPKNVQGGICQLVALLFLQDGLEPIPTEATVRTKQREEYAMSNKKLRQYFIYCIEAGNSTGEGFRSASRAYADIGMRRLLDYVAANRNFPAL